MKQIQCQHLAVNRLGKKSTRTAMAVFATGRVTAGRWEASACGGQNVRKIVNITGSTRPNVISRRVKLKKKAHLCGVSSTPSEVAALEAS